MRPIRNLIGGLMFRLLLWTGGKFFNSLWIYDDGKDGRIRALLFAVSRPDMNSAARTYVENLDEPNQKLIRETR